DGFELVRAVGELGGVDLALHAVGRRAVGADLGRIDEEVHLGDAAGALHVAVGARVERAGDGGAGERRLEPHVERARGGRGRRRRAGGGGGRGSAGRRRAGGAGGAAVVDAHRDRAR